jgi:predicted nucleic acid-binding protein
MPQLLERFQLHYAPAVASELREEFQSGREFWKLVREGVLLEAVPALNELRGFGSGERAAINLALEHDEWILLIDDRRPSLEAERRGLRTLCTPVLVVDLYVSGQLTFQQAYEALARLAALQTVSADLLTMALAQLEAAGREREREKPNADDQADHLGPVG